MKNYLFITAIVTSLIVGLCAVANYVIDPFAIYSYNTTDSGKLSRIEQFPNMRLNKPWQVEQVKPQALIIGSSRTGGIRPAHSNWNAYSAYNFSTPGMTIYEIKRSVQHANAVNPLIKLMIGLDYSAFILPEPMFRLGFEESRLAKTSLELGSLTHLLQKADDMQSTLLTLDALGESMEAITQKRQKIRQYYPDGSWHGLSKKLTGRGGYIYVARTSLPPDGEVHYEPEPYLEVLRELLRFCYANNIETKLFFTPTHVFFVDLWQRRASGELWRNVHRKIVRMNQRLAREYKSPAHEIWGFGAEHGIVDEPIYHAKDTPKAWFNDGVHFRPRLAGKIMAAMWNEQSDFGEKLTPRTVDKYLNKVNERKNAFLQSNKNLVSSLHSKIPR